MKSRPAPAPESEDSLAPANDVSESAVSGRRYIEERPLGRGAMGAVYLVRDRETGEQLALKKLLRMDAKNVLRLKREFRTLADVRHRNLVKLYDLGCEADTWFLTMEYVPGVDLSAFLGFGSPLSSSDDAHAVQPDLADMLARIEPTFHQLAAGVHALHGARVLHRDLKPSNVLVADERVVVLDFGLARGLDERAAKLTDEGNISGTPAYMAPEQIRGEALTEASDWYAFGSMLYEALTGMLPHAGSLYEILHAKLKTDPQSPIELDPNVSPSLSALCMELLARDPSARPSGLDVLARLEPAPGRRHPPPAAIAADFSTTMITEQQLPQTADSVLYGRVAELGALHEAQARARAGRTTIMRVSGISGAGKSALVEEFLKQIERRGEGTIARRRWCCAAAATSAKRCRSRRSTA